jgi:hypothetical protein
MASDEMIKAIAEALVAAPNGLMNGARAFGDQAKWVMGGYGDTPYPAPYDGGPNYPARDDANAYVRNNFPPNQPQGWGMQQPLQTWRR